jgi:hypothetical protein
VIAALYVRRDGPYWDLPGVDPWDEERDARLYRERIKMQLTFGSEGGIVGSATRR